MLIVNTIHKIRFIVVVFWRSDSGHDERCVVGHEATLSVFRMSPCCLIKVLD